MTDSSTDEPSATAETNPTTPTPAQLVREDLNAIAAAHGTWNTADARSTEACHLALGEIFVRSAPTDENPKMLTALRGEVLQHREVVKSRKYNVTKEFAAELHLTLLFGLKTRRGVKSNWKNTIKAAEKCLGEGTIADRTVDAFVEWIEPLGMKGARKLLSGSREDRHEKAILEFGDHRGEPFIVPLPLDEEAEPPHGYFLILGRYPEPGEDAEAITLLTDKRLVASVCTAAMKLEQEAEAEALKAYREEMENADTNKHPADLLIPKHWRAHFDGRFHYKDEDERNEFLLERAKEKEEARRKRGSLKTPRSQIEVARRYGDKIRLPEDSFDDSPGDNPTTSDDPVSDASVAEASNEETEAVSAPVAEEVDYFAGLDTD